MQRLLWMLHKLPCATPPTRAQALQPGQLVSGAKGAAAYHAWTLMQLANEKECQARMLQVRISLGVFLLWIFHLGYFTPLGPSCSWPPLNPSGPHCPFFS